MALVSGTDRSETLLHHPDYPNLWKILVNRNGKNRWNDLPGNGGLRLPAAGLPGLPLPGFVRGIPQGGELLEVGGGESPPVAR